jgi:AcrR family transcriptional regulator
MKKITRKEQAANTKKRIFETAVSLVKEKGYENVTVSEICKTAGLAKGSFYVHYKSKEDIVRESYYADMGTYVETHYSLFVKANPSLSPAKHIICFLNLELEFASFAGYELTCLAYSLNLGACIPGPSEHFQRRIFSKILFDIIAAHVDSTCGFTSEEIFHYFESLVRGLMATWCFSSSQFNLTELGKKFIEHSVYSIFPNSQ